MARIRSKAKKEKPTPKIGKTMVLTISGNVGINETPSSRLDIVGNNKV